MFCTFYFTRSQFSYEAPKISKDIKQTVLESHLTFSNPLNAIIFLKNQHNTFEITFFFKVIFSSPEAHKIAVSGRIKLNRTV